MTHVRSMLVALLAAALLVVGVASNAHAESVSQLFAQANASFFQGDYAQAAKLYQALVDAGIDDADVYYNLGTAHARNGECGRAIWDLERSLRLSAGDDAAENNLQVCQTILGKRRAQKLGEATVQTRPPWSDAVLRPVSLDFLGALVLVLSTLFFVVLIARSYARVETLRLSLSVSASLIALSLAVALLALSTKAEWLRAGEPAIVLAEGATLREGPDPRAKSRGAAEEGEPARVLQREGDFVRVRLQRGAEGWLSRTDVGVIDAAL